MRPFCILSSALLIMSALFLPAARAQKISFDGGVVTGIHGADMVGDKEEFWGYDYEKSGMPGFSAGPFVRCNFSPETFAMLEFRYITKGSNFGYINQFFTQSFEKIRFTYIEVPVLAGINGSIPRPAGDLDFSFETGLAFSRLFSSGLKYDDLTQRESKASLRGFRDYDISWIGQIQFPYRSAKNYELFFGFHIERSIISIHEKYRLYNFDYGFDLYCMFKNL